VSSAADETRVPVALRSQLLARRASLRLDLGEVSLETLGEAVGDLERANELSDNGYVQQLAEVLERQRQRASDEAAEATERSATMRLARVLPTMGEQRRGLELLVGWVKRKPDDADAVRGLGQFAADAQKWGAAAKAFQRLFEVTEGDEQIEAVVKLADACERAGSPMEARGALEDVYRRDPNSKLLRAQLRRMYEAAGAYQELAGLMIAEADNAPDDAVRYERLIEAGDLSHKVEGGERTAVVAYQRALALRPDDHQATISLCDALAVSGEIEEAATILDTAIYCHNKRRSPELSELQHCMARVGRIAEEYEAVFAWLEAAVQSDCQNGAAAAELAVIAMQQGELDAAIRALQAVTLLKEPGPMSRAEAYLRQGMIAEQKGDRKKAVFLAKRALTTDPEFADAKAFLEQLGEA
jgi:tetratricopeptide (TPR) repeat protein